MLGFSSPLCSSCFLQLSHLVQPTLKGRQLYKAVGTRRQRSLGLLLAAAYHTNQHSLDHKANIIIIIIRVMQQHE